MKDGRKRRRQPNQMMEVCLYSLLEAYAALISDRGIPKFPRRTGKGET